jgi:UTP--glucose-1-phosphate uridylyltransferase
VIPAAGLGSRLLPLTKAIPKEMLPVGDKPVIEHTVRELVDSGITDITIVVSGGKSLIQDHFRLNPALVTQLRSDGKTAYADAVEEVAELARRGHITCLDQHGPYGNGTPVLNAARSLGDEAALVLWPDDVFVADVPRAQQLIRAYEQTGCPILALLPMDPADSQRYGVPIVKEDLGQGQLRITGLVEKPEPAEAPSGYAAIGGYVITPGVVNELREQTRRWYEARDSGRSVGRRGLPDRRDQRLRCRPCRVRAGHPRYLVRHREPGRLPRGAVRPRPHPSRLRPRPA